MVFYFTGTGNSLYVAKQLEEKRISIPQAIHEEELKADIIYACGPTPMLRAIKTYAEENGIEC